MFKRENFRGTRCKLIQCKWKKLWQVNAYNVQILLVLIKFYPEKLELSYFSCLKQWVCKFWKQNMKIYYFKSWKTPIFGPKIDFCNFNQANSFWSFPNHFQSILQSKIGLERCNVLQVHQILSRKSLLGPLLLSVHKLRITHNRCKLQFFWIELNWTIKFRHNYK